uniref:Protein translocase subunit SecA n=1 Tax=Biddulphia biddulphiana TaxID=1158022 RepID=A0A2U9NSM9_9STRA|nr:preprotein-translocase subunit a [Biddulphia biddulphiana]AWT40127.1 preprotein-translocase subunit a [Biddulphia biddulphiana]
MFKKFLQRNPVTKNYVSLINQINCLEKNLKILNDNELKTLSFQLKKQYAKEQDLTLLITQSFALTREASVRTLGLRHFDVQLIGGLVLNSGKIAEMQTGEGKTLVATLPAYLNALTKKGVHIVTVNEYLANRDQVSMGQIYRFLGLNTGLIREDMTSYQRKQNYNADITYVTNSEIAFDYLRDNQVLNIQDAVLRYLNYCIIDEIDSILIDEARVPLIISNPIYTPIYKYITAAELTNYLELNLHFKVQEKTKNIILTSQGSKLIEQILKIQDLYNEIDPWIPYILNAIKANTLYFRNVHYIIQNNEVIIVDEFTGRTMGDRRWGDGLHQAIEAKEKLPILENSETLAQVTYQNFFLLYPKLSGMTGTAKTSEIEFEKVFKLSVEVIPTAQPSIRKDLPDFIYKDQLSKWNAVAKECKNISSTGQPILIGTTTVEKSEVLSNLLNEYKLSYELLNAKPNNLRRESEIIAQAGKECSITIATNMAGRGTDIILGGNVQFRIRKQLYSILVYYKNQCKTNKFYTIFPFLKKVELSSQKFLSVLLTLINNSEFLILSDEDILRVLNENDKPQVPKLVYQYSIRVLFNELIIFEKKRQKIDNKIVKNLGGLYIIGTERNDSRRIDNQLRGRCGRQGDPGTSRFFVSLDDKLLRIYGGPNIQKFMQSQFLDNSPLEDKLITKSLNAAQKRIEEDDYNSRKILLDYDDVLNKQRIVVYYERRKILESKSVREIIMSYAEQIIADIVIELRKDDNLYNKEFIVITKNIFGNYLDLERFEDLTNKISLFSPIELKTYLFDKFWFQYQEKLISLEVQQPGIIPFLERTIILLYIDRAWKEHLKKMSLLLDSVGWRAYGQRNPLYEYQEEAYQLFLTRNSTTRFLVIFDMIRSSIL